MKLFTHIPLLLVGVALPISSLSVPVHHSAISQPVQRDIAESWFDESLTKALEKRRGGGGSGGRGSSGGSSSSGSTGSTGSSGSSGSTGSTGSSGSSGRTGSTSSSGGSTSAGSGVAPAYGGGRYYGGGAVQPYTAGLRSPLGLTPFLLPFAALSIFPGLWLYSAYAYPYHNNYSFRNRTRTNSTNPDGVNQTLPVLCLCQQYSECGCDEDTSNTTFLDSVVGNGSYAGLPQSVATVSDVNGTTTLVLNGTLANGTTAPGGQDDTSGAARQIVLENMGWWVVSAVVAFTAGKRGRGMRGYGSRDVDDIAPFNLWSESEHDFRKPTKAEMMWIADTYASNDVSFRFPHIIISTGEAPLPLPLTVAGVAAIFAPPGFEKPFPRGMSGYASPRIADPLPQIKLRRHVKPSRNEMEEVVHILCQIISVEAVNFLPTGMVVEILHEEGIEI
ncbi:MAG: hypothetical protein M1829_002789 [Trizodia sp. TS-e1964]|nr:MAG: hypothetical protein M1829_002789 [Trizodia sp. TS-e1964]